MHLIDSFGLNPVKEIIYEFNDGYEPVNGIQNKITFEKKTNGETVVSGDIPIMFIASLLGQFDKDSEQYCFYICSYLFQYSRWCRFRKQKYGTI